MCTDILSNETSQDTYAVLTQYYLNVSTSWGMYRECNYYPPYCHQAGSDSKWRGQRDNSSGYGYWYSLPAEAQCAPGGSDFHRAQLQLATARHGQDYRRVVLAATGWLCGRLS